MAKVGRAARVASKQRTEKIGTSDKTIGTAETGELYIINNAATAALTLPAAADGDLFQVCLGPAHYRRRCSKHRQVIIW